MRERKAKGVIQSFVICGLVICLKGAQRIERKRVSETRTVIGYNEIPQGWCKQAYRRKEYPLAPRGAVRCEVGTRDETHSDVKGFCRLRGNPHTLSMCIALYLHSVGTWHVLSTT